MRISIFGLGYVGAVSAACFAKDGHTVIGVDAVDVKVELINKGETPIIEKEIGEIIRGAVAGGRLRATTDGAEGLQASEVSMVCVGTPSQANGDLDTSFVRRVCNNIGVALKQKADFHVVAIRSTILPGTIKNVVIPALEESSGKAAGVDFGVCSNPEFLREGTAVYDFYHPPKTIIGASDEKAAEKVSALYDGIEAPLIVTDIETAEMVKYTDNTWHALKIGFANEIGTVCKAAGIDSHKVMEIFCRDTKLNISPAYLKPGFAFGGSCLPKDVRALQYHAKSWDIELPIIENLLRSNRRHMEKGLQMVMDAGASKVGVLGFSFKAGTDDLRESPVVEMIERLIGKGYDLKLYDRNVNLARLIGANRDYILNKIPHIAKLMVPDMEGVLDHAEVLVIGNNDPAFRAVLNDGPGAGKKIIDLVRISGEPCAVEGYEGICW